MYIFNDVPTDVAINAHNEKKWYQQDSVENDFLL